MRPTCICCGGDERLDVGDDFYTCYRCRIRWHMGMNLTIYDIDTNDKISLSAAKARLRRESEAAQLDVHRYGARYRYSRGDLVRYAHTRIGLVVEQGPLNNTGRGTYQIMHLADAHIESYPESWIQCRVDASFQDREES